LKSYQGRWKRANDNARQKTKYGDADDDRKRLSLDEIRGEHWKKVAQAIHCVQSYFDFGQEPKIGSSGIDGGENLMRRRRT
jgi:hypothetical protein